MKHMFAITLALVSVLQLIQAECPNGCSGAGTCSAKDMCKCFKNYEGNDCSLRTCPFGNAHVDSPKGDLDNNAALGNTLVIVSEQFPEGAYEYRNPTAVADEGHFYAECSNRGICGRETGDCACFEGYDGSACQRTSCLNNCSGKGTCESIKEFATDRLGKIKHTIPETWGDRTYSLWDAKSSYGCKCDPGFFGPDCSQRHCKVGVDPMFESVRLPVHDTIVIHHTSGASPGSTLYIRIKFFDYWGESFITNRILYGASTNAFATNIKAALEALPNGVVKEVICEEAFEYAGRTGTIDLNPFFTAGAVKEETVVCRFTKNAGKHRLPEIVAGGTLASTTIDHSPMIGEDAEMTKEVSTLKVTGYDKISAALELVVTGVDDLGITDATTPVLIKFRESYYVATAYSTGTLTVEGIDIKDAFTHASDDLHEPLYYSILKGTQSTEAATLDAGGNLLAFANTAITHGASGDIKIGDALFMNQAFYKVIATDTSASTVTIDRPYYATTARSIEKVYVWEKTNDDPNGFPTLDAPYVLECSGRGLCDHGSNGENGGVCQCFPGYTNDNCDTQNILAF